MNTKERISIQTSKRQQIFADWAFDLLVYIVILNLFVEYSSAFKIESFTVSILTAFVLKILLVIIIKLEHRVSSFFSSKPGQVFKILNILVAFTILFLSKFLILEVIDFIFGEAVEIKGLVSMILLVLTLILSRKLLEYVYKKL